MTISDAPPYTLWAPALARGVRDPALTLTERAALLILWQELSTLEFRPMKSEAFGHLVGMRRENAARVLRRLVATGYLVMTQPAPREPRLFLLRNT